MNNFHIKYDGDRWNLTADGTDRTFGSFETKPEAISSSRHLLAAHSGTLSIHGTDGMVEDREDFPPDVGILA